MRKARVWWAIFAVSAGFFVLIWNLLDPALGLQQSIPDMLINVYPLSLLIAVPSFFIAVVMTFKKKVKKVQRKNNTEQSAKQSTEQDRYERADKIRNSREFKKMELAYCAQIDESNAETLFTYAKWVLDDCSYGALKGGYYDINDALTNEILDRACECFVKAYKMGHIAARRKATERIKGEYLGKDWDSDAWLDNYIKKLDIAQITDKERDDLLVAEYEEALASNDVKEQFEVGCLLLNCGGEITVTWDFVAVHGITQESDLNSLSMMGITLLREAKNKGHKEAANYLEQFDADYKRNLEFNTEFDDKLRGRREQKAIDAAIDARINAKLAANFSMDGFGNKQLSNLESQYGISGVGRPSGGGSSSGSGSSSSSSSNADSTGFALFMVGTEGDRLKDANSSIVGRHEGGIYKDASGTPRGRLVGDMYQDEHGDTLGWRAGDVILDANSKQIGRIEGGVIKNANSEIVGRVE